MAGGGDIGLRQAFVINSSEYYDRDGQCVQMRAGEKVEWPPCLWNQSVGVGIIKQEEGRTVMGTKGSSSLVAVR